MWSVLLFFVAVVMVFVGKHTLDDISDFIRKHDDNNVIASHIASFAMPYSLFSSWALVFVIVREPGWKYSILYSFLLFVVPFYHLMIANKLRTLIVVAESYIVFLALGSVLNVDKFLLALASGSIVMIGKICMPSSQDRSYINVLSPILCITPLLFVAAYRGDHIDAALIFAVLGSIVGCLIMRAIGSITAVFLFYAIAIISCRMCVQVGSIYVLLSPVMMALVYSSLLIFRKSAVVSDDASAA